MNLNATSPSTGISATTLFHFTPSLANLQSILTTGFRPCFCFEIATPPAAHLEEALPAVAGALPMVCFCDLPLSHAKHHFEVYGSYAIGLKKDWALRTGVTPIAYGHPRSGITNQLYRVVAKLVLARRRLDDSRLNELLNELIEDLDHAFAFTKPYEGEVVSRVTGQPGHVRFYDEREWRWVPYIREDWLPYRHLSQAEWANLETRTAATRALWKHCRLDFAFSDVRYIVVAHESEVESIIAWLREPAQRGISAPALPTVVSVEQIRADF